MKSLLRALWVATAMVPWSVACGGHVTIGGTGGGGAGSAGGAGGGSTTAPCPAAEPSGGTCSVEGRRCTYGTDVRPNCRHDWTCSQGQWTTTKSLCIDPPPTECAAAVDGQVCPTEGDHCAVGNTICTCNACLGGPCMQPPPKWSCAGPPTTAGCPTVVPNDGTACAKEGLECVYGNPCLGSGADVFCTKGVWTWNTMIACPAG